MNSRLIHDITPAVTKWDKQYSHIEYLRAGLLSTFAKKIWVRTWIFFEEWLEFEDISEYEVQE